MIGLSDQNMATNQQCYKDREDYSRVRRPRNSMLTQNLDCLTVYCH